MPILIPFQGNYPQVDPNAFVAETAVLVGAVTVQAGASIWYGCVLRGDVAPIVIGAGSNIQDGTVIHVASEGLTGQSKPTLVGREVTVGHMALLHACMVQDGSFIGMKACVMDGAVIEPGAMVAAGSLIAPGKRVPSGQLWWGNPGRLARELTAEERAFLQKSALFYQELAQLSQSPPSN